MSNEWAQKPMRPLDDRWRFARPGRVHKSSTLVTGQNRRRRRRVAALKTTLIFFFCVSFRYRFRLKAKTNKKATTFYRVFQPVLRSATGFVRYRFRVFFLFTAFSFIFVCLRNEFYRLDREREREKSAAGAHQRRFERERERKRRKTRMRWRERGRIKSERARKRERERERGDLNLLEPDKPSRVTITSYEDEWP